MVKPSSNIIIFVKTIANHLYKLWDSPTLGETEEVEGFKFLDNGDLFKGNWVKDKRIGWGLCLFQNGAIYQGEWVNDMPEGSGIIFTHNGDIFEGEFFKT